MQRLPRAQKKTPRVQAAAFKLKNNGNGNCCSAYFDTDFLNMRSIFSLIASMAVEFACEVDKA
jgi:hypothetical protein